jgi:metal-responsive CopG/Arc/MetJ family transcriptional regulator
MFAAGPLLMATANISLLYTAIMPAKPVQISFDTHLLERVDADPETRARGRSAFIRAAVERYLETKARRRIDAQIAAAYAGHADDVLAETVDLLEAQAWPDE